MHTETERLGAVADAVLKQHRPNGVDHEDPPDDTPAWPALSPVALHGLAGELVRDIEPHSEADPAALLVQTLVAFGVMAGRMAHVRIEGDRHFANLFALLVGQSSKARKGTSWGRVRDLGHRASSWPTIASGLTSGEGLKFNVRDPLGNDQGIADKRLLVIESEFAQVLRNTSRPGNTLSVAIREAWDTGRLATLTKNDPVTATGAHVGIIGHITADELRAELTATDRANGFANRFLFVAAKRSKCLPFGGASLTDERIAAIAARLEAAASHATMVDAVTFDRPARDTWAHVYPVLSEGLPGLLGAVTARAEAQVIRLALTYALLDKATAIGNPHLLAALALWDYCEQSARVIFGAALGDPVADELLRAIRAAGDEGLTRTAMSAALGRHQTAARIDAALRLLTEKRLIQFERVTTGGRPAEVWRAT